MAQYVGLPYTKGSPTTKAAAKSMVKVAKNQRQQVWEYIRDQGKTGATHGEIRALGISGPRVTELYQLGRVKKHGKRLTKSKREADVYVAIDPKDWMDKRAGWPTPYRTVRSNETQKWKKRAEYSKALYHEAQHRIEELEKELEELNEQN